MLPESSRTNIRLGSTAEVEEVTSGTLARSALAPWTVALANM